ncbi:hypothetical protein PoB_004361000 [Plakobranchus ocellatus]|uniref:Uncharacterized protein n=1 Tax=Plakobranchus ocellatus TaxID=259542 RepID=A0AAV4BC40_9GAST|nr:hypothetical protein PoB_004361000 [Plakobranchus ocellatus]
MYMNLISDYHTSVRSQCIGGGIELAKERSSRGELRANSLATMPPNTAVNVHNNVISGFQALSKAIALVAGIEHSDLSAESLATMPSTPQVRSEGEKNL